MGPARLFCFALLAAPCAASGSLDFAVSAPLDPQFDRFAVDGQGNIVIASAPYGCSLPVFNALSNCGPIWVGKLDPTGQNLLFGAYLGTVSDKTFSTWVAGVGVDAAGNIVVAAYTSDRSLPTVNAFQASPPGPYFNAYVARFAPDGMRLTYATYLGGSGAQQALSLAVDAAGAAYIALYTTSPDFPTTPQSAHDPGGTSGMAIAKLNPDGTLQYGVTFGFEFYTDVKPIQVDSSGAALLTSTVEALQVSPDGSKLTRTNLPSWAPAANPWVLPAAAGGFWVAGAGNGFVASTPGAPQAYLDGNGYFRIENNLATEPQLPALVNQMAIDPANRNRIYAATGMGLYRSDDNGLDWTQLRAGPATTIAVDPFDSTRLYLAPGGNGGLYRSIDSGGTWSAIGGDTLKNLAITALDADPNIQGLIYAASGVVFRSKDGGDTWDEHTAGPTFPSYDGSGQLFSSTNGVKVDGAHAGWAYALGVTRCIGFCPVTPYLWRTQDGGNTWSSTGTGVSTIAIDPNTGDVAATTASAYGSGGFVIYPAGDFTSPRSVLALAVSAVAFDPQQAGSVYVATPGAGGPFIMSSQDDAATWMNVVQLDRAADGLYVSAGAVLHAVVPSGSPEGFLAMTDGSGNLAYATYIGAAATQVNVAAQGNGLVYVAGAAQSGIPAVDAYQPAPVGGADGFLTAFTSSGAVAWSTYLGGSGADAVNWVFPLADGSVVVVGTTNSTDFPMMQPSGVGAGTVGAMGAFIARLRP